MIELQHVSKTYGIMNPKRALSDVSFSFGPGEIIGLFGENGAGKSTLFRSILGLVRFSGRILLDGEPIGRSNITRLSYATSAHSFIGSFTAAEHAEFCREHFPRFNEQRFRGLMDFFALPDNRRLLSLSAGQQNQVEVILALSQGADYILMDEPFSANDLFNREDFYRLLTGILEPWETVLLSTHLVEEAAGFVTRALLLHEGKLLDDIRTDELDERGETLLPYLKSRFGYRADRVGLALDTIVGKENPHA